MTFPRKIPAIPDPAEFPHATPTMYQRGISMHVVEDYQDDSGGVVFYRGDLLGTFHVRGFMRGVGEFTGLWSPLSNHFAVAVAHHPGGDGFMGYVKVVADTADSAEALYYRVGAEYMTE